MRVKSLLVPPAARHHSLFHDIVLVSIAGSSPFRKNKGNHVFPFDAGAPTLGHLTTPRKPVKLLIAEDNVETRNFIKSLMCATADEILEVASGDEAVRVFDEQQPDWVLMDIQMPGIDGIEATRRICAEHPEAKIMIVSTYATKRLERAAREAGALGYVKKENMTALPGLVR